MRRILIISLHLYRVSASTISLLTDIFVFFAFPSSQPAGRDLIGLVAPFLSVVVTSFFNLTYGQFPATTNLTKPLTHVLIS